MRQQNGNRGGQGLGKMWKGERRWVPPGQAHLDRRINYGRKLTHIQRDQAPKVGTCLATGTSPDWVSAADARVKKSGGGAAAQVRVGSSD